MAAFKEEKRGNRHHGGDASRGTFPQQAETPEVQGSSFSADRGGNWNHLGNSSVDLGFSGPTEQKPQSA